MISRLLQESTLQTNSSLSKISDSFVQLHANLVAEHRAADSVLLHQVTVDATASYEKLANMLIEMRSDLTERYRNDTADSDSMPPTKAT